MKKTKILSLAALIVSVFFVGAVSAGTLVLKTGKLWLEGDSTLHTFSSKATQINITGQSAASGVLADIIKKDINKFEVEIPVKGLKSGESGLDRNLYSALNAEKFSQITFQLSHYEITGSSISAEGLLSISGTQKPVKLEAVISIGADGAHIQGQYKLLMTDFGVKPPTLFLGSLKVRNPVTIYFDLNLIQAQVQTNP